MKSLQELLKKQSEPSVLWKWYIKGNSLSRREFCVHLAKIILRDIEAIQDEKELKIISLAVSLQGYFDDLIEGAY